MNKPYTEFFKILNNFVKFEYYQGDRFPSYLSLDSDNKLYGFLAKPNFLTEDLFEVETTNKWYTGLDRKSNLNKGIFIADLSELLKTPILDYSDKVWNTVDVLDFRFGSKRDFTLKSYLEKSRDHQESNHTLERNAPLISLEAQIYEKRRRIENLNNQIDLLKPEYCNCENEPEIFAALIQKRKDIVAREEMELKILLEDWVEVREELRPVRRIETEEEKIEQMFGTYRRGNATLDELARMLTNHFSVQIDEKWTKKMVKMYESNKSIILPYEENKNENNKVVN